MSVSAEIKTLAGYLAGEFDNQAQAMAEPAWYVHLRLWKRPLPVQLFSPDSLILFAEQANIVSLDKIYRQRILEIGPSENGGVQVQYYMLKNPAEFRGAGANPELLSRLTPDDMEFLPGCTLNVTQEPLKAGEYQFQATLRPDARCCFTYQEKTRQVSLGFEVTPAQLLVYDKGIDPATGKALWGALFGPFRFAKRQDFSGELPIEKS
ncbi:MAG TPA: chromophore lyase CpcT/CpeT [Halomicronema sp.]